MMKKRASAMLLGALLAMTGSAFAADMESAAMPAKEMSKQAAAGKDGMLTAKQAMEAQRMRAIERTMQSAEDKMREDQYRGI